MATVEQGMHPHTELPQTSSSTLNFMPSTAVSSWGAHNSYGAIWEPASSTTTSDHGEGRVSNSINLMGRMAYTHDHENNHLTAAGGAGFNINIMEGNVNNWMGPGAKYTRSTDQCRKTNDQDDDEESIIGGSQLGLQYLNPLSPHESEAVSSCVLQQAVLPATSTDEAAAAAAAHPLLMQITASHGFLKRDRDHHHHQLAIASSVAADHPLHYNDLQHRPDSPMHKKQRSSAFSTKETSSTTKEDPAAAAAATSNGSSDVGPALNTNGRPRAKRGSATDPQSVYARQRRERINERLKILQNLVPNGAKVDIVTMLEEAISYVKFLQLQVKLLSSDEYWMYAPTTYNGIDVSFDMLQHSS